jgi:hypothetical protein
VVVEYHGSKFLVLVALLLMPLRKKRYRLVWHIAISNYNPCRCLTNLFYSYYLTTMMLIFVFLFTQFEEIYRALIRAVHYRIGATDRSATANLHTYMRKVISVSDEQHSVWMHSEIQEAMPPRTLLRVSVKKGKKLPAKDSNGKFCFRVDLHTCTCVLCVSSYISGFLAMWLCAHG